MYWRRSIRNRTIWNALHHVICQPSKHEWCIMKYTSINSSTKLKLRVCFGSRNATECSISYKAESSTKCM
jgi:hypothetical protein